MVIITPLTSNKAIKVNKNGGIYKHGSRNGIEKKMAVAKALFELQEVENNDNDHPRRVTDARVAQEALVSTSFARKVRIELEVEGRVVDPGEKKPRKKKHEIDYGSRSLSEADQTFLLQLCKEVPGRSLRSYQMELQRIGTNVSRTTISRFFLYNFQYRGSLRKASPVPIAKFAENNIINWRHYEQTMKYADPLKVVFTDEKSLKALELFGNRTRTDPFTGQTPPQFVAKDFRIRYAIIGMISLKPWVPPLLYDISQQNTTAERFMSFVEMALGCRYLERDDVLVLDNAPWHCKKEARILEDFLWNAPGPDGRPLHILCVFLPAYSAELNPIELVWNIMLKKHRDDILEAFARGELNDEHATARAACRSMEAVSHKDVEGCYRHCEYLPKEEEEHQDDR